MQRRVFQYSSMLVDLQVSRKLSSVTPLAIASCSIVGKHASARISFRSSWQSRPSLPSLLPPQPTPIAEVNIRMEVSLINLVILVRKSTFKEGIKASTCLLGSGVDLLADRTLQTQVAPTPSGIAAEGSSGES